MRYLAVLSVLALTIAACSDAPGGIGELELAGPDAVLDEAQMSYAQGGNPLLGVWKLTSFSNSDGEVELPKDFSLVLTFTPEGEYSLAATNTSDGFVCEEPQTSCTISGTYTYTATTITLDEEGGPEPGPDTGLYLICGGRLIYMDFEGDDGGARFSFGRTRRDCYVRDCP